MSWRPEDFGGIASIKVPADLVWKPDMGKLHGWRVVVISGPNEPLCGEGGIVVEKGGRDVVREGAVVSRRVLIGEKVFWRRKRTISNYPYGLETRLESLTTRLGIRQKAT